MIRVFILTFLVLSTISGYTQSNSFPFGQVTLSEFGMKTYDRDTSAVAVVLKEFGEAWFDPQTWNLMFDYHVKIKILKTEGLDQADFSVSLYKGSGSKPEILKSVNASTYNFEGTRIQETKLDSRKVFTENYNKYYDLKKFALPNVKVGSIIEVQYTVESPFIYNFKTWEFQSDIPKISSEFWAKIPGNYLYNVILKGFLKLTKNESTIIKECVGNGGSALAGGYSADCALNKYAMKNIPALIEEDYMTAPSNFLASIHYELSEVRYFDGRVDKVTKEWKDADGELKKEQRFGIQLKKGKDIGARVEAITAGVTDPTEKTKKIYTFVKTWFKWNEIYGFYSDLGIKKAFESKTGNIGDINLSLIAALNHADINTEPMLLSTRSNGLPTEIHPVLSDFNYVVAKVTIGDNVYLLDASDPYLQFGMLPERCLNGKGRVFGEKGSYWYDLKPSDKDKKISILDLTVDPTGVLKGTIDHAYHGYSSVEQRKKISSYNNHDEYIEEVNKKIGTATIKKYDIEGVDDFEAVIKEKLEVEIEGYEDMDQDNFLFNPFTLIGKIERNPFRSSERLYPVDFGAPLERTVALTFRYPSHYELVAKPESMVLTLPASGGKFLFDVKDHGDRLTVNYSLSINKPVFNSAEYHYLKELFNRIIDVQNSDLIFKKKG